MLSKNKKSWVMVILGFILPILMFVIGLLLLCNGIFPIHFLFTVEHLDLKYLISIGAISILSLAIAVNFGIFVFAWNRKIKKTNELLQTNNKITIVQNADAFLKINKSIIDAENNINHTLSLIKSEIEKNINKK